MPPSAMTLASFLFDQLWRHGVRHVFGIPGDFALNLYEALEADGRFSLVRFSHEPAVGFAADGCARITGGLGVCLVTYGAGGLNMVNAVACAYAEESPLVVVSGGPGRAERRRGIHVHHEVKSFESQFKVYQEVTEYSAILDNPRTAAAHICRALDAAVIRDFEQALAACQNNGTPWLDDMGAAGAQAQSASAAPAADQTAPTATVDGGALAAPPASDPSSDASSTAPPATTRTPADETPVDEWGMFDPDQAGFAALVDKLDAERETGKRRKGTKVRVLNF